jgi:hypothetical protein
MGGRPERIGYDKPFLYLSKKNHVRRASHTATHTHGGVHDTIRLIICIYVS